MRNTSLHGRFHCLLFIITKIHQKTYRNIKKVKERKEVRYLGHINTIDWVKSKNYSAIKESILHNSENRSVTKIYRLPS